MKENNYAFIDGNNLYLGAQSQGIKLDYRVFRLYLKNKLSVSNAFLFIGYNSQNTELYTMLQQSGYVLVFKPTIPYLENGKVMMKGNVDAELVLSAAAEQYAFYDRAVIVSGDGDFGCLMHFLDRKKKLLKIITPTEDYSALLKPYGKYIQMLRSICTNTVGQKNTGIRGRSKP